MKRIRQQEQKHRERVLKRLKTKPKHQQLKEDGYCVITGIEEDTALLHQAMQNECAKFPMFKAGADQYVLGGFSAFANPGSIHNVIVRMLRINAYEAALPVLKALFDEDRYIQVLIDRMMVRKPGVRVGKESFHRDLSPAEWMKDISMVLGGWINTSEQPQYFSMVPGSQLGEDYDYAGITKGFLKVSKQDQQRYRLQAIKILVPPGGLLMFDQSVIHEVLASTSTTVITRLFTGFAISKTKKPFIDYSICLRDQGVPLIKSGQKMPVYPRIFWCNWFDRIMSFSDGVKPVCLETKTRKRNGVPEQVTVVRRFCPSLREMNLPFYMEYSTDEIAYYTPQSL